MNVGGIPFAGDGHGFWTVVVTLIAFTAAVGYLALRKFRE
jgi:Mg2+ and Co2+ transporter CorA